MSMAEGCNLTKLLQCNIYFTLDIILEYIDIDKQFNNLNRHIYKGKIVKIIVFKLTI